MGDNAVLCSRTIPPDAQSINRWKLLGLAGGRLWWVISSNGLRNSWILFTCSQPAIRCWRMFELTTYPLSAGINSLIAKSLNPGCFDRDSRCESMKAIGGFGRVPRPLLLHRLCSFKDSTQSSVVKPSSCVVVKRKSNVLNGDAKVGSKPNLASLALHRQTTCSICRLERLCHVNYAQNLRSTWCSCIMQLCQVSITKATFLVLSFKRREK